MWRLWTLAIVLVMCGMLTVYRVHHPRNPDPDATGIPGLRWVAAKPKLSDSERFINAEEAKINAHAKLLVAAGHMTTEFTKQASTYTLLGQYNWHGGATGGYFGAYSYYEPAFQQARRGWFMHGEVLEGNNEFWPEDDWDSDKQASEIKFDASIIGYQLPRMSMAWAKDGKVIYGDFTAKIVGVKENGHTLILDKYAPHQAEQWGMEIVPPGWQDLCNCTNNFHPAFINGGPVATTEN